MQVIMGLSINGTAIGEGYQGSEQLYPYTPQKMGEKNKSPS